MIGRFFCFSLTFVFSCFFFVQAEENLDVIQKKMDCRDYKGAIAAYIELSKTAVPQDRGLIQVKLAKAYYKDQNPEMAFQTFLEGLSDAPRLQAPLPQETERHLYDEALKIYLEHPGAEAHQAADRIRIQYSPILAIHPDYYLLNFLEAAAYANLGMFDEFFERFYRSYLYHPESYMAYKTKAVLHLKLFEKSKNIMEKEAQRRSLNENALKALSQNPLDTSLYKLLIQFSDEKDKKDVLRSMIKKLIEQDIKTPRTDIFFYVKESVSSGQVELAQQFVDKAHQWYAYSKTLNSAQDLIDQAKR